MKRLIILMVVSLSLAGSFSDSYADVGDFMFSFNGTGGTGIEFVAPLGIAVDSEDRIIVTDNILDIVQVYQSDGTFVFSFDGTGGAGAEFETPLAVAVDSNDRIIVSDSSRGLVQVYESDGTFNTRFNGAFGGGTPFVNPFAIAVDSENRIIVSDIGPDTIQIFDSNGIFITSFDGSDGGTAFAATTGLAVDNLDRIIVTDVALSMVQIFNSTGHFITSFDGTDGGGAEFLVPAGVTVDDDGRILVADTATNTIQIFNSNGIFLSSFDGGTGTDFSNALGLVVDSDDRIIVGNTELNIVQIFEGFMENLIPFDATEGTGSAGSDAQGDDNNGGCADCTPPTLGLDAFDRERIVDNGFSYNGNSVQVEKWHTPFPLITTQVGQLNTVEIIVYENQGIHNMEVVQFGLGATKIGQPLNDLEVLIEVWLDTFSSDHEIGIEKIIIKDRDNLIETFTVFAVVDIVQCADNSYNEVCLKVTLEYSYRETTINNIMVVNVADISRNSQNFFFNDGVQVVGVSLNEPPTYVIQNKQTSQQTEDLTLTLTRTDKINHIWVDKYGIEYFQVSSDRFDRLTPHTPMQCTDPPLDEINVPTRQNCNFRELTHLWSTN